MEFRARDDFKFASPCSSITPRLWRWSTRPQACTRVRTLSPTATSSLELLGCHEMLKPLSVTTLHTPLSPTLRPRNLFLQSEGRARRARYPTVKIQRSRSPKDLANPTGIICMLDSIISSSLSITNIGHWSCPQRMVVYHSPLHTAMRCNTTIALLLPPCFKNTGAWVRIRLSSAEVMSFRRRLSLQ